MTRLIDADALMDTLRKDFTEEENDHQFIAEEWWWAATVRKTIENAPTVDAVEVVRCEECVYHRKCMLQHFVESNAVDGAKIDWNKWYCADGERRDE